MESRLLSQRLIKKICFMLALLILFLQGANVYAQATLPSGISETKLEEEIEKAIGKDDGNKPMAISVFKGEETLFESYRGFANRENGTSIDEDTVFEWGSITKLLVWVSVMQLYEEGKLDLNQDVRELLPEDFFKKLRYDKPITIINLMNHQGGWQDNLIGLFVLPEYIEELEETIQKNEPIQIEKPGSIASYSNYGVALTALIVEKISGKNFYEYVHENIFIPLDMKHTGLAPDFNDNLWVKEQREKIEGYVGDKRVDIANTAIPLYPAGQTTGILRDITKFAKALADSSEKNPLFKNPDTIKEFYEPTLMFEEYGLPRNAHGMWITNYSVSTFGHDGGTIKFFSKLIFDPESKYGLVVLTNDKHVFADTLVIPQIIFGKLNSNINTNLNNVEKLKLDNGFYINARSFYEQGILKVVRLFSVEKMRKIDDNYYKSISFIPSVIEKNDSGIFESKTNIPVMGEVHLTTTMGKLEDGRNIIHKDYGDMIQVSNKMVILDIVMFILFIVSILYTFIAFITSLIALLIRGIKKLFRKETKTKPVYLKKIGRLSFAASTLIILFLINLGTMLEKILAFKIGKIIDMQVTLNLAIAVIMFVSAIIIIFKYKKIKNEQSNFKISIFKKLNLIFLTKGLIIIAICIIYWDLWRR